MDYRVQGNDIIVYEPDLDLDETLDCGQAFRWKKIPQTTSVHTKAHFSMKGLPYHRPTRAALFSITLMKTTLYQSG